MSEKHIPPKILISKREAAHALSVSVRTLENYIARKELPVRHLGRRALVPLAAVEKFARNDHASPVVVVERDQQ